MGLRAELHCHNVFSNYNGSFKFPLDCGVTIEKQLIAAYEANIDVLFQTNHNTLDGYKQTLEYQENHPKLKRVKVYPGIEVSARLNEEKKDNGKEGHVLAWGVYDGIKRGMTVQETVDEIKRQNGVSCAAHRYGLTASIGDLGELCDVTEVMNSNDVDLFSDFRSYFAAKEEKKTGTAGSDAHIPSAIGKCITVINAENNLEDILKAISKGEFKVEKASYNKISDFKESLHYQLSDSENLLVDVRKNYGTAGELIGRFFINWFEHTPKWPIWNLDGRIFRGRMRNISKKVNAYGYDQSLLSAPWKKRVWESLFPIKENKYLDEAQLKNLKEKIYEYDFNNPATMVNKLNSELRTASLITI